MRINFTKIFSAVRKYSLTAVILFFTSALMMGKQLLLARVFEPEGYVVWSIGNILAMLFSNFGALGASYYTTHFASGSVYRNNSSTTSYAVGRLILIFLLFSPVTISLLAFIYHITSISEILVYYAFSLATAVFTSSSIPLCVKNSRKFSLILLSRAFITFVLSLSVGYMGGSPELVLLTETAVLLFLIFRIFPEPKRYLSIPLQSIWKYLHKSRKYVLPIILSTTVAYSIRTVATHVLPISELSTYFLALVVVGIGQQIQYVVSVISGPIISAKLAQGGTDLIGLLLKIWTALISFLVVLFLIAYPFRFLIFKWFPKYAQLDVILIPVTVLAIAKIVDIWSIYFVISGNVRMLLRSNILTLSGLIVGTLLFLSAGGKTLADFCYLIYCESFFVLFSPLLIMFIPFKKRNSLSSKNSAHLF